VDLYIYKPLRLHGAVLSQLSTGILSLHSLKMLSVIGKKHKSIPVTGRGGLQGYETSKLPHFTGSRLTDSGEIVSLMRRPPFTPCKIPGAHFF
jgi:hypothetical protein